MPESETQAGGAEEEVAVSPEETVEEQLNELKELRDSLEAAQAQAAEYLDGWQRSQAAFSNFRKRQEAERSQMIQFANAELMIKLLPIGDDFERAIATLPSSLDHLTWIQGFFLIKHKLDAILQSEGVKPIETEGQEFNPLYHEAVTYEVAEGYEEGQIIGEVQCGYMLGDRVLRPALVRVAQAAPPAPSEAAAETEAAEGPDASALAGGEGGEPASDG